jgi:hypothetical protein
MQSKASVILTQLLGVLDSGQVTAYEFSGVARTALRQALCADGMTWQAADNRAAEIVGKIVGPLIVETAHAPKDGFTESECVVCQRTFTHPNHKVRKYLYCSTPCKRSADWQRKKAKEKQSRLDAIKNKRNAA